MPSVRRYALNILVASLAVSIGVSAQCALLARPLWIGGIAFPVCVLCCLIFAVPLHIILERWTRSRAAYVLAGTLCGGTLGAALMFVPAQHSVAEIVLPALYGAALFYLFWPGTPRSLRSAAPQPKR